ncbi:uncharacterized protein si:dkey-71d15.2 isoform X1 [Trichomycterus rosablanca]|uniref:uncharacterized protein si:dkey-71d15.2 isoform X1 n=1 Tax=Trichomycterus rosablanca TaxID=2290929 RepID=UPI002F351D77
MSVEVLERLNVTLQEPDISALKFLYNFSETPTENTVRYTHEATPPKPEEVLPSSEASSSSSMSPSPSVSSLISLLKSPDAPSPVPKPRPPPDGPPTLQRLSMELGDVRDELELLRTQHKKDIKLLINELDEEKKMRLSLQVEVERMKKHMSKK